MLHLPTNPWLFANDCKHNVMNRSSSINEIQFLLSGPEKQTEELTAELAKFKKEADASTFEYEKKLAAAHECVQQTESQFTELRDPLRQMQTEKHQSDIKGAAAKADNAELERPLSKLK